MLNHHAQVNVQLNAVSYVLSLLVFGDENAPNFTLKSFCSYPRTEYWLQFKELGSVSLLFLVTGITNSLSFCLSLTTNLHFFVKFLTRLHCISVFGIMRLVQLNSHWKMCNKFGRNQSQTRKLDRSINA